MPALLMGDNRKSNVLYKCAKCGKTFQALTPSVSVKRCHCGGMLHAVRKIEPGEKHV
jgi:transposase-like protein